MEQKYKILSDFEKAEHFLYFSSGCWSLYASFFVAVELWKWTCSMQVICKYLLLFVFLPLDSAGYPSFSQWQRLPCFFPFLCIKCFDSKLQIHFNVFFLSCGCQWPWRIKAIASLCLHQFIKWISKRYNIFGFTCHLIFFSVDIFTFSLSRFSNFGDYLLFCFWSTSLSSLY